MFEAKPLVAHDSRSCATGVVPEDVLCELRWSDLVARLAAARDLRAELARSGEEALASFDADSARWLATQHGALREEHGEDIVNLDDSANRKAACGTYAVQPGPKAPAIRGNT